MANHQNGDGHPSDQNRRLPTTKRVKKDLLPGFRMTERDIAIIKAVYTHRALSTFQIEDLLFQPDKGQSHRTKTSRVRHRLKLLSEHGYLFRDEQPTKLHEGRKPRVYFINRKAIPLLAEEFNVFREDIDWHPRDNNVKWMFLDHLLATNDVRIAIEVSAANAGYKLTNWLDEKTLKRQDMRDSVVINGPKGARVRATIIPDAYFRLHARGYDYFGFLEVDMGTETGKSGKFGRRDFSRKILAYREYYRSGRYQKKYDPDHMYEEFPMLVLTVTTSPKRMSNLKKVAEDSGAGEVFWFTTFDQVTPRSVLDEPVWEIAGQDGCNSLIWTDD